MYRIKVIRNLACLAVVMFSAVSIAGCEQADSSQAMKTPPVRKVSTVTVQPQEIMLNTELPGRTSAFRVAEIRPQVAGIIEERLFTEGTDVEAGQILYRIDPKPYQAALDNAAANLLAMQKSAERARAALKANNVDVVRLKDTLELANKELNRYEASFKEKIVSASQRDRAATEAKVAAASVRAAEALVESTRQEVAAAEAGIKQAEAALQTARINLEYCTVTAPISGRIGRSSVTEGAIVTAYQPIALATIQQLDPIYVDVPQSTNDLMSLKKRLHEGRLNQAGADQNSVSLIFEDRSRYVHEGTLQFSDITVDQTTGSVNLRAVFPNPENLLLPGMFVRAEIREGLDGQAILLPQQCVMRDRRGAPYALIVNDESKVEVRPLALDRAIADKWLVRSGLAVGDNVIIEGLQMLRPETVVEASPYTSLVPGTEPSSVAAAEQAKQNGGGA